MSELPVLNPESNLLSNRRKLVHVFRFTLFVLILFFVRLAHEKTDSVVFDIAKDQAAQTFVLNSFPDGSRLGEFDNSLNGNTVVDATGRKIGYAVQTSPESDSIIGYSGPTNCLIVLDSSNSVRSVKILASGDTHDHVEVVKEDPHFLGSFTGIESQASTGLYKDWQELDGASGATLTSYAIIASVAKRLSGAAPSLKFEPSPNLANVKKLFKGAVTTKQTNSSNRWSIYGDEEELLGHVLTSTPTTDHVSGYQGPTAFLIGLGRGEKVVGVVVDQTYENEPYANYLDDDYGFQGIYVGKTLVQLKEMIPSEQGIEGVSGATMTSMSVAESIPLVAIRSLNPTRQDSAETDSPFVRKLSSYWPDLATIALTLIGICFSFTKLSRHRFLRIAYQIAVIAFLGFINGHMISQALISGWAASSVPWKVAPGLVFLTAAAFLVPLFSKHQPYCQHICPFGAIQQISKNRIGWKVNFSPTVRKVLGTIPYLLLGFVLVVSIGSYSFNLASVEPFDGFSIRVAGWATIGILVGGLLFSLVSPMAYCRFGCPTGALLNFLRFRADSHRLGVRDVGAMFLVVLAVGMLLKST